MINTDRIVPVTATDLISLYGLILKMDSNNSGLAALDASTDDGQFEVTSSSGSLLIADEPVQSLDIASGVSSVGIYFVPAYDYAGFTVNGAAATIAEGSATVNPDGRTLYKAVLSSGSITITQVGF